MSNLFFYANYTTLPETTITVTNEDVFFPSSNLQHNHTVKEFRTQDGTTTVDAYFDLGVQVTDINSLLLVGNNATGDLNVTELRVRASPTNNWSTLSYDSGAITLTASETNESFTYQDLATVVSSGNPATASRYWRVTLTNTGGDNNFVGCSNIFLGPSFVMANNAIAYGWEFQRVDRSTVQEGRYGQRYVDRINDQKRIRFGLELLDQDEFEDIDNMFSYCGVHTPIWLVIDSDELIVNDYAVYSGYFFFTERPTFTNIAFGMMNTSVEVIEVV